jgi:arabinose-5-phosphate isomerase
MSDVTVARQLLALEIEGLQALSDALDEKFEQAVELVANLKGRLIISGMGKSGHIARKIAATMASTGTPAYFVHPGEASHGDLGMVTTDDAMLLLSNSGETSELRDMVAYGARFKIPMIAMVRRETSMLVEAADVPLVLPATPEASPTGAPTTSTTMMLALGDALAVALLERQGFTAEDFQTFHPGGKLGQRFVKVKDLMHQSDELPLVAADEVMEQVLLTITAKRFGCAGVQDASGALIGIVTDGDLRRHMGDGLLQKPAQEVMTADPITIRAGSLAAEALQIMNEKQITALFVADEAGTPLGILHIHDCLRAGIS